MKLRLKRKHAPSRYRSSMPPEWWEKSGKIYYGALEIVRRHKQQEKLMEQPEPERPKLRLKLKVGKSKITLKLKHPLKLKLKLKG